MAGPKGPSDRWKQRAGSVRSDMTSNDPTVKNLAELYKLAAIDWEDVRTALEANLTQGPGTGGPDHHTFWLSTVDGDGRPHTAAVGAFCVDGHYYFCGGPRSRKIRNIERDPRSAFGVAIQGYDVALEGRAERVTDEAPLQLLAKVFAGGGWHRRWPMAASPISTAPRAPARHPGTSTSSPLTTRTR